MISNRSRQAARAGWTGLVSTDAHRPMALTCGRAGHPIVGRLLDRTAATATATATASAAAFAVAFMAKNPAPPPRGTPPV